MFACFYSYRFWQYFFIDLFCTLLYYDSYKVIHDTIALKRSYYQILKAFTCLLSGYIYSMLGYKKIMIFSLLLLCFLSFVIY